MRFTLSIFLSIFLLFSAAPQAEAQQVSTGWLQSSEYQNFFDRRAYGNLSPANVQASLYNGHVRYQAVFRPAPPGMTAWIARHGLDSATFAAQNQSFYAQGYVLVQHDHFVTEGFDLNQAIWYRY